MLGRAFSHQVSAYQEYWRDDPIFDASNRIALAQAHDRADLDCPILDEIVLERLCDFAIQSGLDGLNDASNPRPIRSTSGLKSMAWKQGLSTREWFNSRLLGLGADKL